MTTNAVLVCHEVTKSYHQGDVDVQVLQGISCRFFEGESIAIVGASGAGKSTFLNILGGLDTPDVGFVDIQGKRLTGLNDKALSALRNQHLGFVYQFHHLLGEFSAEENVAMPLLIRGMKKAQAVKQARDTLSEVGLTKRFLHRPYELSGGERQRVAIARALVTEPALVLMDEPTGNLDETTAQSVQTLIHTLSERLKTCFVIVTHDKQIAKQQKRAFQLHDGLLTEADL